MERKNHVKVGSSLMDLINQIRSSNVITDTTTMLQIEEDIDKNWKKKGNL